MKKKVFILALAVGLVLALSACSGASNEMEESDTANEEETSYISSEAEFLTFEDIDDLIGTVSSIEDSQSIPGNVVVELRNILISSGIPVPYYKNTVLPFRNSNNLSNIILETESAFGYPIIWYYAKIDGVNVIVSAGIVPNNIIAQVDNGGIVKLKELHDEMLKTLPSNQPSVEPTESISSMNIAGENRTVCITQYSTDPRYHIELLIENAYVKIYAYPETINSGVLSDVSIKIVTVA